MCTQSYNNFGIYYLNLSLKIWQAAYYLFGGRVAIFRRAALQDIAYKNFAAFQAASCDYSAITSSSPSSSFGVRGSEATVLNQFGSLSFAAPKPIEILTA